MPGRNESRTCTLCNRQVAWRHVSFMADNRLWRVEIPVCIHPACLLERDATYVDHRTEMKSERK